MEIKRQWKKRVELMQYIYACLISSIATDKIIEQSSKNFDFDADQLKAIEYFAAHKDEIITLIASSLAQNWTIQRIMLVEQAILITSYCEFKANLIQKEIVIDQALITTSRFSNDDSKKYINAILEKILK